MYIINKESLEVKIITLVFKKTSTFISDTFNMYDYGFLGNLLHYGQTEPPKYDLSQISAPVGIFYAQTDYFAHLDVRASNKYFCGI